MDETVGGLTAISSPLRRAWFLESDFARTIAEMGRRETQ